MALYQEPTMTNLFGGHNGRPRENFSEETAGLEDNDELPIEPEEDMSVIPDEERVINVPS